MQPVSEEFYEDKNTPEVRGQLLDNTSLTEEQLTDFRQIQARIKEASEQRIKAIEERIRVGEECIANDLQTYVKILQCINASDEDIVLEGLDFASVALCEFRDIPFHPIPSKIRLQAGKMLQTALRQLDEQDRLQKEIGGK